MVLTDSPQSNGKKSTDLKSKMPEVSSLTGLEKQVEQAEVRPQGPVRAPGASYLTRHGVVRVVSHTPGYV